MDEIKYNNIVEDYLKLRKNSGVLHFRFVIKSLCEKYCTEGLGENAIFSIVSWLHQQDTRAKVNRIDWKRVYNEYKKGKTSLLAAAQNLDISPAIVCKKVLGQTTENSLEAKKWLADSSQIPDGKLAFQVMMAQYNDIFFGQHSQCIATNVGAVFEQETSKVLKEAGVDFSTEKQLRSREYDVTPDFKLNIPMMISLTPDQERAIILPQTQLPICQVCQPSHEEPCIASNGMIIVNWVECKSLFASFKCHREYLKNQYNSYCNRFGKGLIIYRHGCVNSIFKNNPNLIVIREFALRPK